MSQLPAFLVPNGGVNSGFMIPQVTAAALASDNKALAGDILEWSDRACLNKAVRTLASKVHKPFGYIFILDAAPEAASP